MKLALCIVLFACSSALGYVAADGLRQRCKAIETLQGILDTLGVRLRYYQEPLSQAVRSTAQSIEGAPHDFLSMLAQQLGEMCIRDSGRDLDDLISIGSIGLIKAVNTFDPERGRPIGSYAARCIENEILMSLRQEKKTKGEIGIDEVIGTDKDGNQVRLIDVMGISSDCTEQQAETSMDVQRLKAAIERVLGERERVIIELRFGLVAGRCKTQREIADLLGISRSYVSRIEKKALRLLRDALEE